MQWLEVGTGVSRILVDVGEGKPGVLQAWARFWGPSAEDLLETMAEQGCQTLSQVVSILV